MARLARVSPVGVPQHVIQRGNNRQLCFGGEKDRIIRVSVKLIVLLFTI